MTTPILGLAEMQASQSQPHIIYNASIRALEAIADKRVISVSTSTPPGSPSDGDIYIIAATATGAWATYETYIAYYSSGWVIVEPREGWIVHCVADDVVYRFDGAAWVKFPDAAYLALEADGVSYDNGVSGLAATDVKAALDELAATVGAVGGGGITYQGTWNANTNSPSITDGSASTGNKGDYYKVSTAGTTSVDGIASWAVGDWIISNGTTWDKIDNTDQVTSVAGKTGAVTLEDSDITGQPYDIGANYDGVPDASAVILRYKFPREVVFASGLSPSTGTAGTAATAQTDFDIKKNGSSVGTMRFAAAGTSATFIMASQTTFSAGDVLTVVAPGSPDATLADFGFVLSGTR